jgi:hypothetical protein
MTGSPEESLAQLTEHVAILSAPANKQEIWANEHNLPIDELMLQFFDMVPGWLPRLQAAGVIDSSDELALLRLRVHFDSVMLGRTNLFTKWDTVRDALEWQRVRDLAEAALTSIQRSAAERD